MLDFNEQSERKLIPEFTVSQASEALKSTIEKSFGIIRIKGEISGFKPATSGHLYFNLKDDKSVIKAVCWRGIASSLKFKLEEGMEIICTGKLSIYQGGSYYQIIASNIEVSGIGALLALLEKRKTQLAAEGLFDAKHKKNIPFMPAVIGVVTSPTGAVIRDILHRITDRFPVHVIIWPTLVQGNGSAQQIADAINGFNNLPDHIPKPDTIIVARGGGSIEDLWSFNEEIVVRAAANSRIPLISAVGHETDTTLIDYASDRRAPTPTAAAEIAVPVKLEIENNLNNLRIRMRRALPQVLKYKYLKYSELSSKLSNAERIMLKAEGKLDQLSAKLRSSLINCSHKNNARLETFSKLLNSYMNASIRENISRLNSATRLMESFHYKNVLKRGFALIRSSDDKAITSKEKAADQSSFKIEFFDGEILVSTINSKDA